MKQRIAVDLQSDALHLQGFRCRVCHKWHDKLPTSYSAKVPFAVALIPQEEQKERVVLTAEQCVIDQRMFFLRGRISIPIIGQDESFSWRVWAKVEQVDFTRANGTLESQAPPFQGWLNTQLPFYGGMLNCEVRVRKPVGRELHFEVVDPTFPLAVEQKRGITIDWVQEIAEVFLHPGG